MRNIKMFGMGVALVLGAVISVANAASFKFAGTTPPLTLDPHATNDFVTTAIIRQFYDSIAEFTPTMELRPGLATSWSYRGNATWRFVLRQGVKFQDGSAMTADDVAFSIMREKGSRFYTALFGEISEVRKVDERTIDVVSKSPDPILPRKMTRLFVMSKAWLEKNGATAIPDLGAQGSEGYTVRNANGTGPMRVTENQPGVRLGFARNPHYWGAFPGNVTEAVYLPIGAAPTRLAALLSGDVDMVVDLPLQDIERVKGTAGLKVGQTPQLLLMQLELDGTREVALNVWDKSGQPLKANPFKDVRVRQAMVQAIDANQIVDRIMRGNARAAGIASVPGLGGYQADLDRRAPISIDAAKGLLAAAGYPNGFTAQLNCPLERYVNTEDICRAVAGMLARVGIDTKVNGIVWPEFARMLTNGPSSSFHLIGATSNSGDQQDMFLATMMTRDPSKNVGFFNWAMWTNTQFDAVARDLASTFEASKRTDLYRRGLQIAKENVSAIYLHQPMITAGMKANITVLLRADATVPLQDVIVK